jgi:hypothetical protein
MTPNADYVCSRKQAPTWIGRFGTSPTRRYGAVVPSGTESSGPGRVRASGAYARAESTSAASPHAA